LEALVIILLLPVLKQSGAGLNNLIMKHIFTISLCFLALSLSAQETITYPYNPDGDADGLVAVPDLQDLLAVYGSPFSPAEIMVGDTALSEWIQILYQALQDQQAVIEAMQGAGGCDFSFPEGIHGDFVAFNPSEIVYTVPSGKRLYILTSSGPTNSGLLIDNVIEISTPIGRPLIIDENQTISSLNSSTAMSEFVNGLLVNINQNIQPVFFNLQYDDIDHYMVPTGKRFVLLGTKDAGNIIINGNNTSRSLSGDDIGYPLLINSESEISSNGCCGGFAYGYLADEDYFADCGGGSDETQGLQGEQGSQGEQGPQGEQGIPGINGLDAEVDSIYIDSLIQVHLASNNDNNLISHSNIIANGASNSTVLSLPYIPGKEIYLSGWIGCSRIIKVVDENYEDIPLVNYKTIGAITRTVQAGQQASTFYPTIPINSLNTLMSTEGLFTQSIKLFGLNTQYIYIFIENSENNNCDIDSVINVQY